jgi:hypothetical protein
MQKPYRFLVDRVASYAEEGSAFLRRRRIRSLPFVRIWRPGGVAQAIDPGSEAGRRMFAAAEALAGDVDSDL